MHFTQNQSRYFSNASRIRIIRYYGVCVYCNWIACVNEQASSTVRTSSMVLKRGSWLRVLACIVEPRFGRQLCAVIVLNSSMNSSYASRVIHSQPPLTCSGCAAHGAECSSSSSASRKARTIADIRHNEHIVDDDVWYSRSRCKEVVVAEMVVNVDLYVFDLQ